MSPRFKWVKLEVFAGLIFLYIWLWGVSSLFVHNNDLDVYYLPQAKMVLYGKLTSIYSYRYQGKDCLCPSAHGPLSLVPLSIAVEVVSKLNFLERPILRRLVILAAFTPFSFLMSKAAVDMVGYLLKRKLEFEELILTWTLFLFSPVLWLGIVIYGHIELALAVWLMLLALRKVFEGESIPAAAFFALAILSRSSALFVFLTIVSFIFIKVEFLKALKFIMLCLVVVLLGAAPFLISSPGNFIYSIALYRSSLPTDFTSVWSFLGKWPFFVSFLDGAGPTAFSFVIPLAIFSKIKNRLKIVDIFGVLTISSLIFPLIIRTKVWPYYFLEAYIFGTIFWIGSKKRPRWGFALPIYFTLLALFSRYNFVFVSRYFFFKPLMAIMILGIMIWIFYLTVIAKEKMKP